MHAARQCEGARGADACVSVRACGNIDTYIYIHVHGNMQVHAAQMQIRATEMQGQAAEMQASALRFPRPPLLFSRCLRLPPAYLGQASEASWIKTLVDPSGVRIFEKAPIRGMGHTHI